MLFKELKELFIIKLILKIYILSLLVVVEIDILNFILSIYVSITKDTYLSKPES